MYHISTRTWPIIYTPYSSEVRLQSANQERFPLSARKIGFILECWYHKNSQWWILRKGIHWDHNCFPISEVHRRIWDELATCPDWSFFEDGALSSLSISSFASQSSRNTVKTGQSERTLEEGARSELPEFPYSAMPRLWRKCIGSFSSPSPHRTQDAK